MEDEQLEIQDSLEPETVDDDTTSSDDTAHLEAKNRQLFERAKKAEEELKKLKSQQKEESPETVPKGAITRDDLDAVRLENQGYSEDEIAEIRSYAKGSGKSLSEAVKSPFVKQAIDAMRAEKQSGEATPSPSNRIATDPPASRKEFKDMSRNEQKADFMAALEAQRKKRERFS